MVQEQSVVPAAGTDADRRPARRSSAPRARFDWIAIAKGIGIVLVAAGHFYPEESPHFWVVGRGIVYSFHMPLFFLLSGWLYQRGKYTYPQLIANKTRRLLYPFATIAIGLGLIKLVSQQFLQLENPLDADSALNVLLYPLGSYAPLLWFLQVLFLIFCLYPLLNRLLPSMVIVLLFVLLNEVLNLIFGRHDRWAVPFLNNMPYFALGAALRERGVLDDSPAAQGWRLAIFSVLFAMGIGLQLWNPGTLLKHAAVLFALGVCGTMWTIAVSQAIARTHGHTRSILLALGVYSMMIYVLHAPFEGAVRVLLQHVMPLTGTATFLIAALLAVTAGILAPVVIEKTLIRRSVLARKLLLGSD